MNKLISVFFVFFSKNYKGKRAVTFFFKMFLEGKIITANMSIVSM